MKKQSIFLKFAFVLLVGMLVLWPNLPASASEPSSPIDDPVTDQVSLSGIKGLSGPQAVTNWAEMMTYDQNHAAPTEPTTIPFLLMSEDSGSEQSLPTSGGPDLARHTDFGHIDSPSPAANFSALEDNNTVIPPDTHGVPGPTI